MEGRKFSRNTVKKIPQKDFALLSICGRPSRILDCFLCLRKAKMFFLFLRAFFLYARARSSAFIHPCSLFPPCTKPCTLSSPHQSACHHSSKLLASHEAMGSAPLVPFVSLVTWRLHSGTHDSTHMNACLRLSPLVGAMHMYARAAVARTFARTSHSCTAPSQVPIQPRAPSSRGRWTH